MLDGVTRNNFATPALDKPLYTIRQWRPVVYVYFRSDPELLLKRVPIFGLYGVSYMCAGHLSGSQSTYPVLWRVLNRGKCGFQQFAIRFFEQARRIISISTCAVEHGVYHLLSHFIGIRQRGEAILYDRLGECSDCCIQAVIPILLGKLGTSERRRDLLLIALEVPRVSNLY
jgi:hypothetical protein